MNFNTLSFDEFLRYANTQIDDLTSSDLERELLRRLEAVDTDTFNATQELEFTSEDLRRLAEAGEPFTTDEMVDLMNAANNSGFAIGNIVQFLDLLAGAEVEDPDDLKDTLAFATNFQTIANDAGDVITRLNTLITETQE